MPVALGLSQSTDLDRALDLAVDAARAGLGREEPETLLTFISTAHGRLRVGLGGPVGDGGGAAVSAACQVEGLLASAGDLLHTPAVAAIGFRGLGGAVYTFDHGRGREQELGDELSAAFGPFGDSDLLLVVADARALDPRALAAGLAACAPAAVLGLGVAGPAGEAAACVHGADRVEGGALAVHLRAPDRLCRDLAPGTRLCEPRTISSARGHWLLELDGACALDEFRDASGALWDDEQRALRSVLVALPPTPGAAPDPGLVREVVGLDSERGAIAVSEPLATGSTIAFARRDPVAALEELSRTTAGLGALPAGTGLGLAVSCGARGEALFGHAGIESGYLSRAFAPDPWLGLVGSYQLGSRHGASSRVLTHATAFAHLA